VYRNLKVAVVIPAYEEESKIGGVVFRVPKGIVDLVLVSDDGHALAMGSRFLSGGQDGVDMPLYRRIATRLHSWLLSLSCGKSITLGFKHGEFPGTGIHPPVKLEISRMEPVAGWWEILHPVFLLGLKLER
jgi:hypothetical protein